MECACVVACSGLPELKFPKIAIFNTKTLFWKFLFTLKRLQIWRDLVESYSRHILKFSSSNSKSIFFFGSQRQKWKINEDHWFSTKISLVSRSKNVSKGLPFLPQRQPASALPSTIPSPYQPRSTTFSQERIEAWVHPPPINQKEAHRTRSFSDVWQVSYPKV